MTNNNMKKILLIGNSVFNPSYFNTRINGDESTPDDVNFANTMEQLYNVPVKSVGISGAGNEWPVNGVISNLDEIDSDTLVVIMWAAVDRFDMHFDDNIPNDQIGFPRAELLPEHVRNELSFFRTYGLNGDVTSKGIRFWATGPTFPGRKRGYREAAYSEAIHLKQTYQNITLVQKLLEGRCFAQKHILPFDIDKYVDYDLIGPDGWFIKNSSNGTNAEYVWMKMPKTGKSILESYPELQKWKSLVDWSLFTRNYLDYFAEEMLPYWGGMNAHNVHQVPFNNYKFISSEILPDPADHSEFFLQATIDHCRSVKVSYPIDMIDL